MSGSSKAKKTEDCRTLFLGEGELLMKICHQDQMIIQEVTLLMKDMKFIQIFSRGWLSSVKLWDNMLNYQEKVRKHNYILRRAKI